MAGVQLLLGTDAIGGIGIVPGFSVHDELRILVENGFTPYEALLTGTVNAAYVVERMTGEGNFGTIEVGNRADLILVSGNPLEDISNIRPPLGVMASGRWFSHVKHIYAKLDVHSRTAAVVRAEELGLLWPASSHPEIKLIDRAAGVLPVYLNHPFDSPFHVMTTHPLGKHPEFILPAQGECCDVQRS